MLEVAVQGTIEQRFWSKVDKRGPAECWPWTGTINWKGYGRLVVAGRSRPAPQIAWEVSTGQTFPKGMFACHSCDNPQCVNPTHIWVGTNRENQADCAQKGRRRHPQGEQRSCPNCGCSIPARIRKPRKAVYPRPHAPYENWTVTLATKNYRCEGCSGEINPGTFNAYIKPWCATKLGKGTYFRVCSSCASLGVDRTRLAA